jgi:hypothetical protein
MEFTKDILKIYENDNHTITIVEIRKLLVEYELKKFKFLCILYRLNE